MALFYDEIDKKSFIYQPNMSRSRQRYRGPRDSQKINLEISQFLYDLNNINKKTDEFILMTLRYSAYVARGTIVDGIVYSGTSDNVIVGILEMASEIEDLKNRIIEMERKYV
jgi:hypothetical protein